MVGPVGPGEMHPPFFQWRPGRSYSIMLDMVSLIRNVMSVYCTSELGSPRIVSYMVKASTLCW